MRTDTDPVTIGTADGPITQQIVEDLVARKFGPEGLHGKAMLRSVSVSPEGDGFFVQVDVSRGTVCVASDCNGDIPDRVVTQTADMSRNLMSSLFLYNDVTKVQLNIYGSTDNIGDEDKRAASVVMTRDDERKIDWANFTPLTMRSQATSLWLEPHLQAYLDKLQASGGGTGTVQFPG